MKSVVFCALISFVTCLNLDDNDSGMTDLATESTQVSKLETVINTTKSSEQLKLQLFAYAKKFKELVKAENYKLNPLLWWGALVDADDSLHRAFKALKRILVPELNPRHPSASVDDTRVLKFF